MGIDLLQVSFAIGFVLAFFIYVIAYFSGKGSLQIRTNVLLIGILVLIVTFSPFQVHWWQVIRLGSIMYVCILLISNILRSVGLLLTDLYENSFIPERMRRINQGLYIGSLALFILLIMWGNPQVISASYTVFVRILFACLGLLLALMLLRKN
ncbi:MAG TPA: hypothetical protein QGF02_03845 [Candidatus Babeliales bacterium]|nr:hypothetical protein [Candidatus Babeliales bacterium]